jgi:hypothetical protein
MQTKKIWFKWSALALWLGITIALFLFRLQEIPLLCDAQKDALLCSAVNFSNYLHNAIDTILFASLGLVWLARQNRVQKWLMLLLAFLASANSQRVVETSMVQEFAYGIEYFFLVFSLWIHSLILSACAWFVLPHSRKRNMMLILFFSVLIIPLMAFSGRGTVSQYAMLVGNMIEVITWKTLLSSQATFITTMVCAATIAIGLLVFFYRFIRYNEKTLSVAVTIFVPSVVYVLCLALAISSLWLGFRIHKADIAAARTYIEKLEPAIRTYFSEKKEYPKRLEGEVKGFDANQLPFLLARHNHMALGAKDGFFFSKPDSFCFLFDEGGWTLAYASKTNQRGWRLSHKGQPLADKYAEICDAKQSDTLLSEHLGLSSPDDELGKLGYDMGVSVRPAISVKATAEVRKAIQEIEKTNPEMFKDTILDKKNIVNAEEAEQKMPIKEDKPARALTEEEEKALDASIQKRLENIKKLMPAQQ